MKGEKERKDLLGDLAEAAQRADRLGADAREHVERAREAVTARNRLIFEASRARVPPRRIAEASGLPPWQVDSIIEDWRRAPEPGDTITLLCPNCKRQGRAHVPEDADPAAKKPRGVLRCPKCQRGVSLSGLRMNAQGVWYSERGAHVDDAW